MKTVRFDKHYSKLDEQTFTTIRKHKKDILNQTVKIITPETEFIAKCVKIEKKMLGCVNLDLFKKDTDTENVYDGLSELNRYYPGLKLDDTVYVYYFERKEAEIDE